MKFCFLSAFSFFFLLTLSCTSGCANSAAAATGAGKTSASNIRLFYDGLKAESALNPARAADLFEQALNCPSPKIQREAAQKLAVLLPRVNENGEAPRRILKWLESGGRAESAKEPAFTTLKAAALYAGESYGEIIELYKNEKNLSPQDRAFKLLAGIAEAEIDKISSTKEMRDFFYSDGENSTSSAQSGGAAAEKEDLLRWVLGEFEKHEFKLSAADTGIMNGKLALLRSRYAEALEHFSAAEKTDLVLFFLYPALLGDLGRSYQWTPSRRAEGLTLFAAWEKTQKDKLARFYLLFYTGRIIRQQGKNADAIPFFARALETAPNAEQEDACIWYLLDSSMKDNPETTLARVKTYSKRWHRSASFNDILDELCCYLAANEKWLELGSIIPLIEASEAAQYAYILGRAYQEGYVRGQKNAAADYFTIAYEASAGSFYYRALAASRLGKSVVPLAQAPVKTKNVPEGSEEAILMDFYQGFFEHDADQFFLPYFRGDMNRLSAGFLRTMAQLLAGRGRYLDSISVVRSYMRRDGYVMERPDLELYYPRAFTGLMDENAKKWNITPPVFYGLVRTESGFMPEIVSHAGAVGLAQIMPGTAREVNSMIKRRNGSDLAENGTINLNKPEINLYIGAFYLNYLTDSLGSPMLALLGYNGGPAKIRRLRRAAAKLPEDLFLETITTTETREYGKRVMAAAAAYGYLYFGMSMEQIVADIFK